MVRSSKTQVKPRVLRGSLVETDQGWIGVVGSDDGLIALEFPLSDRDVALRRLLETSPCNLDIDEHAFVELAEELKRYFAGEPVCFSEGLDPSLGTPFQRRVWDKVRSIPYGATMSYGEVARLVGSPGAARAVGSAMHSNPVPIVVPCHRVIGADGALRGFGGGLELKRQLLRMEGVDIS